MAQTRACYFSEWQVNKQSAANCNRMFDLSE